MWTFLKFTLVKELDQYFHRSFFLFFTQASVTFPRVADMLSSSFSKHLSSVLHQEWTPPRTVTTGCASTTATASCPRRWSSLWWPSTVPTSRREVAERPGRMWPWWTRMRWSGRWRLSGWGGGVWKGARSVAGVRRWSPCCVSCHRSRRRWTWCTRTWRRAASPWRPCGPSRPGTATSWRTTCGGSPSGPASTCWSCRPSPSLRSTHWGACSMTKGRCARSGAGPATSLPSAETSNPWSLGFIFALGIFQRVYKWFSDWK